VWFNSSCPPECGVTGSITLSNVLPSNLLWATPLLSVDTPLSYSFTDGLNTFTETNSTFSDQFGAAAGGSTPYIATGAGGDITAWSIALSSGNLELRLEALPVVNIYGPGLTGSDSTLISCCSAGVNIQAGSSGPGTWSGPIVNPSPPPTPAPEPPTLLLLLTGAASLLGKKLFR